MIFIYGRAEDSPLTRVLEALDEAHVELAIQRTCKGS